MNFVRCNLCGQDDWEVRFPATLANPEQLDTSAFRCTSPGYGRHAQIVRCRNCSLIYANPRWSPQELLQAYAAVEDETYVKERSGRELTFRKHLSSLEKWTGAAEGRSLLDVGAYIGVFVEIAAQSGWDAWGIEPSAWAADIARSRGLKVLCGTQQLPELHKQQFDVVTMWDVIEHFDDPRREIEAAFDLLNPGGWLAVHTMDSESLLARLMGRRWPWLMDMHLYYFSQQTLTRLLTETGFEIEWTGVQGRYLSLGYVATRLEALNHVAGIVAAHLVRTAGAQAIAVPVNFGDLFTVFARRPAV